MKDTFRRVMARLLEFQARRLFAHHRVTIVGVSGAVGKTSTKLAIATVLRQKYRVLVQNGSFNDEIGLPLACFNLDTPNYIFNPFAWLQRLIQMETALHRPYPYQVLVIEIGTDAPGEVAHTLRYLHPDIGVVTAVTPEHMEYFGDLDTVAKEELSLVAGSRQAVVNYDDVAAKYRRQYVDGHPAHWYYGLDPAADYHFQLAATDPVNGTTGSIAHKGHASVRNIHCALYGAHSAKMLAAAYAVGQLLDLTDRQLRQGLEAVTPMKGRMNPLPGINGATLVDDTYNSSPEAVVAAVAALAAAPVASRRLGLMGSMNELGDASPRYHEEAGAACAGLDLLVTLGDNANRYLGPAAVRAGLDPTRLKPADSPQAAGEFLRLILQPGDVLLAKGSQNGVFAEEALKPLLANPADAAKLVRQSPAWLRRKAKQFPGLPQ